MSAYKYFRTHAIRLTVYALISVFIVVVWALYFAWLTSDRYDAYQELLLPPASKADQIIMVKPQELKSKPRQSGMVIDIGFLALKVNPDSLQSVCATDGCAIKIETHTVHLIVDAPRTPESLHATRNELPLRWDFDYNEKSAFTRDIGFWNGLFFSEAQFRDYLGRIECKLSHFRGEAIYITRTEGSVRGIYALWHEDGGTFSGLLWNLDGPAVWTVHAFFKDGFMEDARAMLASFESNHSEIPSGPEYCAGVQEALNRLPCND